MGRRTVLFKPHISHPFPPFAVAYPEMFAAHYSSSQVPRYSPGPLTQEVRPCLVKRVRTTNSGHPYTMDRSTFGEMWKGTGTVNGALLQQVMQIIWKK